MLVLGLNLCDCRAIAVGSGEVSCDSPPITLQFDFDVDICSDCLPDSSSVSGTFTLSVFGLDIEASFESTEIGFPVCTIDEQGNQTLTVFVEGILTHSGGSLAVSFELSLNEGTQEVCIDDSEFDQFCVPATVTFGDPC